MGKVLAFACQKGGSGKTTLASSAAVCAVQAGFRVAIVDTDRQASSLWWGELRRKRTPCDAEPFVHRDRGQLQQTIDALREQGTDLVIIDTPGIDNALIDMTLRMADLTIVPSIPSPVDLPAARVTFTKARQYSKQAFYVLTKVSARGHRTDEARECLSALKSRWLSTPMVHRVDYMDAFGCGLGVTEFNPKGSAAQEVLLIWTEIAALLGLTPGRVEC